MCARRALLLDRLDGPAIAGPRGTAAPVSALAEIREAAIVQRGGNKKAWHSEEIYEAVKTGFERLRGELDDFKPYTELDEGALGAVPN